MSLCDICPSPGACCKHIYLSVPGNGGLTTWVDHGPLAALIGMAALWLPFLPLEEEGRWADEEGRLYRTHFFGCPALGDDGRCTIYETRPELCRDYQPKQDRLCVLHEAAL